MTTEKKSALDSFFDVADQVVGKMEGALKDAHYPDKVYDHPPHPSKPPIDIPDAEIVSETKAPNAFLIRLRVELYTAIQKLKGPDLLALKALIDEIHSVLSIRELAE